MRLPSRKWWFILLGGLALLLLVALVALPMLADVDRYRGLIQAKAEEALGREVRLGELKLSFVPFGVRVDSLSIAALPDEGGGDFLTAKSVQVGARLLPLLSKRLEVTTIEVVSPEVTLVRGADGDWNVQRLVVRSESAGDAIDEPEAEETGVPDLRVDSLRLTDGRIHVRDARPGLDTPLEMTLEQIDLHLRDVSWGENLFPYDLSAVVGSGAGTKIEMSGRIGPLVETPQRPFKFEAKTLELREIDPVWLAQWFEGTALPQGLQIERPFSIGGFIEFTKMPETGLRVRTALTLAEAEVSFTGLDGNKKNAPFDFGVRAEVLLAEDGSGMQLPEVKLKFGDQALFLSGSLARKELLHRVDVDVEYGEVRTDALTKLAALLGVDLPVGFSSEVPIGFEAGLHGYVGEGQAPELAAKLTLSDLTLRHPSMDQPIEQVGATVLLKGDHLEVDGLEGVVGSSDVAGRITLDGFGSPLVGFDLHSRNADFGELFSFLDLETEQAQTPATPGDSSPPGEDPLAKMTLKGRIRIDRGTFRTLDFSALEAEMSYAAEVLTLDPVTMQLYDGTFRGRIESDLAQEPATFDIRGNASEVDVDAFITDNMETSGLLAGRFSGALETRGAGTDFESIVRSLEGAGSVKIDRGTLGKLNLLDRLSSVSGLFGATTLQNLTGQMATEGTEFESLSGEMQLSGGQMQLENLFFDSPAFDLRGEGVVDLLASALDGRFRLSFSPEISSAMRSDHSRAARAFWNSSTNRIELPLTLSGPFDAPMPGIDFEEVAENLLKQEVRDYIGERLGLLEDDPEELPQPGAVPSDRADVAPSDALPDITHADLSIEFAEPEWRGSFFAKDLQIAGTFRGARIDHASLLVVDSEGREVHRVERQEHVETHLASAADRNASATIGWRVVLDGKRLLQAEYPLTVTATLYNTAGESARTSLRIDR